MTQLNVRAKAFEDSAAKHNTDKTPATKIHLQKKAKDVLENESQLKKHQKDLEKLVEELKETLDQYPVTGENADEAVSKVEADAFDYIDKIENALNNHDILLAEAEIASKPEPSSPPQRNVPTPAIQTQQGDVFRDVGSLKPNFLEKSSNLMEVLHWTEQARNYIEAGYRDTPPKEGTYKYILPFIHSFWAGKLAHINPKSQDITTILSTLETEAKKGDPRLNRRLRMLQIRRGSDTHSDSINKLIEAFKVIEFDKMTASEFIIHLFIRDADNS